MTTAFTFPGQGSQAVGMGKALAEAFAPARAVFAEVDEALGQKLSHLMFEGPEAELDAAIAMCRRRRIGPFARAEQDDAGRMKALGALARAGFAQDVAQRALDMAPEEAEERLLASRRG